MAGFVTREEAEQVATILDDTFAALPKGASALRARIRVTRDEYRRAIKMFDRAVEDHDEGSAPEFRALGSLEAGELVQLASPMLVKRTSETGLCISEYGKETWINFSGKTSPVVVTHVEIER